MSFFRSAMACAVLAIVPIKPAFAIDLYRGDKPQANQSTCQSYSAVLALAAKNDHRFPIEDFEQLRAMELEFRSILKNVSGGQTTSHEHWSKAMEELTGGLYTLKRDYEKDITEWMTIVRDRTTLSDDIDGLVAELTGGPIETVLTSVMSIDGSSYGSGHIVTVIAVVGSGLDSTTQLAVFNSAIKGSGGSVNECAPGNQPGDEEYKAGVVQTNEFRLKDFGNGFALLMLEEK